MSADAPRLNEPSRLVCFCEVDGHRNLGRSQRLLWVQPAARCWPRRHPGSGATLLPSSSQAPATAVDFTTLCGQFYWSRARAITRITRIGWQGRGAALINLALSSLVVPGRFATQFDRSLRRHPCINTSDPARFCKGTNDTDLLLAPNPLKLSRIEFDSTTPEKLLGNQSCQ